MSISRILIAAALGMAASACSAQEANRRSQLGTVSQMVMDTRIEIAYRRPVARGRALFGALVPWGRVWTPSADTAVLFTTSTPIRVNGEALAAGTYSLWAIPGHDSWTMIFSKSHPAFHLSYREGDDALRVRAAPRSAEHMETLAFYFPLVDADSAALVMHWGRSVVPLTIRARP